MRFEEVWWAFRHRFGFWRSDPSWYRWVGPTLSSKLHIMTAHHYSNRYCGFCSVHIPILLFLCYVDVVYLVRNVNCTKTYWGFCLQSKNLQKTWWRQLKEQESTWHSRYSLLIQYIPKKKVWWLSLCVAQYSRIDSYSCVCVTLYCTCPTYIYFVVKFIFAL